MAYAHLERTLTHTDRYSFVPKGHGAGLRPLQKLVIDRQNGGLQRQAVSPSDTEPPHVKQFVVHGILGIITLHTTDFIIVITNRKHTTNIAGSDVYLATDFRLLPVSSDANPSLLRMPVEKKLISLVKEELYLGPLYFSYDFDLTSSFQRQVKLGTGSTAASVPLWKRADSRFFWNYHVQKRLMDHSVQHPEQDLSAFILPVMFGFLETKVAVLNERAFLFGLVARRSRFRAGTRYFSRGVDDEGHVSNFNETEQFVLADPAYPVPANALPKPEQISGTQRMSYVQTRGSVPVYWAEVNNLRYKPDLLIPDQPQLSPALRKHMSEQVALYGKNYLVNLVNQEGYERPVKEAYERAVEALGNPLVQYLYFDFHHQCKGMRFDRVSLLLERLEECGLAQDDYFALDTTEEPRLQLQKSVVRTNCMDCLDRTNVVQGTLARWILNRQLRSIGILGATELVEDHAAFMYLYRNMWADHADVISKAYSGTGALKTDFTRTGKRTFEGMLQDGLNSASRYIKNNFFDGSRQDALDLFTGAWDPRGNVPHVDARAWPVRLMPWLLATSLLFVLLSLVLPPAEPRPFQLAGIGPVRLFPVFWGLVAAACLVYIWERGLQYVAWPTLNRPEKVMFYDGPGYYSGLRGRRGLPKPVLRRSKGKLE